MPTLILRHICYTQLDPTTWCATAQFISPCLPNLWSGLGQPLTPISIGPLTHSTKLYEMLWQHYKPESSLSAPAIAYNKRQRQRRGVRLLLRTLLNKLNITDTLDDTQFPYRLADSQRYVCFSHSATKVAVVINDRHPVGIDIETQDIAWQVVQRFYHPAEITVLAELPLEQRFITAKWLWQIKESFIKIYQYKLAQGLGINYVAVTPYLLDILQKIDLNKAKLNNDSLYKASLGEDRATVIVIDDNNSGYQIAILPYQQTIIVF
ncbi:4'-phosphopantetheinyl transferase family protein [Psychrobacter frigidicola]|uniref:4'-phosphopantetheinyl transferase family protein n=1 Tax=Psychrobacter frigidicola TaxID=45611 RepID=UPI001918739F|nr:4'-phosphopantetheinyl transferase superfamily protein [Psychrobacter frigidicola]